MPESEFRNFFLMYNLSIAPSVNSFHVSEVTVSKGHKRLNHD